ncbi:pre-rRNA-processing protein TSR2 homolog [Apostichopus japonicus]|uniref:pre-rRNA-processing protein TSR2 homolog n=1 Tax=Stichopus japonicus TaxID=307972 RepID=UPI003AB41731
MAAPISAHEVFRQSVSSVFRGWTGLQLAVQNGCGGPHAKEKAEWMVGAVFDWFMENDGIYPDELEEFIADILNNEFDTIAEDGSVNEIAQRICLDFVSCSGGHTEAVLERIQKTSAADLQSSVADASLDMDDDDDQEADMQDHNVQAMFGHVTISNQGGASCSSRAETGDRTGENDEGQKGDDEWTVVSKNRKR